MKKILILLCVLFAVGTVIGFYLWNIDGKSEREFRANVMKYPLLSPRILRDTHTDFIFNFLDLRTKLHEKIDSWGTDFALYFEYLPTGTSININANNDFYAASLFKLPVVMAYFRHKERDPGIDHKTVKLTQDMIDSRYGDLWQKGVGYEIGMDEAAELALVKSDNTAAEALSPAITQEDFDNVYQGLDININIASQGAILNARNYAAILKALYFAAVLTRDDSQKILDYLSNTDFNDKLVAGVPAGVKVAHKIGVIDPDSYRDCGIVYVPNRPYIICMVSKGTEQLAQVRMKEVSQLIYDNVSSAKSAPVDN